MGERIDAILSGSVSRSNSEIYKGDDQNAFSRYLRYNARLSFRFFIENNVSFNVACTYTETDNDQYSLVGLANNQNKYPSITFGIDYRFL
jgi:hypothetical protein